MKNIFTQGLFLSLLLIVSSASIAGEKENGVIETADFCSLFPLVMPETSLVGSLPGDIYEEVPISNKPGNFSWVGWSGDSNAVSLTASLVFPGNSDSYVNPYNPEDSKPEIGDWLVSMPGVKSSRSVRENLSLLLGREIIIPLWSKQQQNGGNVEFLISNFAVIKLSDFDLSGKGYYSFEFIRYTRCYNLPPKILSQPVINTAEGEQYVYPVETYDPDGDELLFELLDAPSGMKIDQQGVIYWEPDYEAAGQYEIQIKVSDTYEQVDTQAFILVVENTNRAPEIEPIGSIEVFENSRLEIQVSSVDPDGDAIEYSIESDFDHLMINQSTGLISMDVSFDDSGEYTFNVLVQDALGLQTRQEVSLTIVNVNRAPVVKSTPEYVGKEGVLWSYSPIVEDPDGDELLYAIETGPEGLVIDPVNGRLSWLPNYEQAGEHRIELSVADYEVSVSQSFTLIIENTNRFPDIVSQPNPLAVEEAQYTYHIELEDLDTDDTHAYVLISGPENASVNLFDGKLVWTPTKSQLGLNSFHVQVQDDKGGVDDQHFSVIVNAKPNLPPVISSLPELEVRAGQEYQYQIVAVDPEGYALTFVGESLPQGAEINSFTGGVSWVPSYDQRGPQEFILQVKDIAGASVSQSFVVMVGEPVNTPPTLLSQPKLSGAVNQLYTYQVVYQDAEGNNVEIDLLSSPEGMVLDAKTGLINWVPVSEDVGMHQITMQLDDQFGGIVEQQFVIQIAPQAEAGQLKFESKPEYTVTENTLFEYKPMVSGLDADRARFQLLVAPESMAINRLTGEILWLVSSEYSQGVPAEWQQCINHYELDITEVKYALDEKTLEITVSNTGGLLFGEQAIVKVESKGVSVSKPFSGVAAGESQTLQLHVENSLQGDVVVEILFEDQPDCYEYNNISTYAFVELSSQSPNGDTARQAFLLSIEDENELPEVSGVYDFTVNVESDFEFKVDAKDADLGDVLSFALMDAPESMLIDNESGMVNWFAAEVTNEPISFYIQVTDLRGDFIAIPITINVVDNHAPLFTSAPVTNAYQGETYLYKPGLSDPDVGDELTLNLVFGELGLYVSSPENQIVSDEINTQRISPLGEGFLSCESPIVDRYFDIEDFDYRVIKTIRYQNSSRFKSPVVAPFYDTNKDGYVDGNDDVTLLVGDRYLIHGFNARTGARLFTHNTGESNGAIGFSVGDLNNDGKPELIYYLSGKQRLRVLNHAGKAVLNKYIGKVKGSQLPIITDLENDGEAEVLFGGIIYSPKFARKFAVTNTTQIYAADIDLDGTKEILAHNKVFDHKGQLELILDFDISREGLDAVEYIPVNIDSDNYAELLVQVDKYKFYLFDTNGDLIWGPKVYTREYGINYPYVGDLDGDGAAELFLHNWGLREAYVIDIATGELKQKITNLKNEQITGQMAGFDFNGDGAAELIRGGVRYFDQQSGKHYQSLVNDYFGTIGFEPIVADTNGDGEANIIAYESHNETIKILASPEGDEQQWMPSKRVWNQRFFSGSSVNQYNASVLPTIGEWPWLNSSHISAQHQMQFAKQDLVPLSINVNQSGNIVIWVSNQGDIASEISSILVKENDSQGNLLGEFTLPSIKPGAKAAIETDITAKDVTALWVMVDPQGQLDECRRENNYRYGDYVELQVSDSLGAKATQAFYISAFERNSQPVITSQLAPTVVESGEFFTYNVDHYDADAGDTAYYLLLDAPEGMTIEEDTGVISWLPPFGESAFYNITIRVIDSTGNSSEQQIQLTLNASPVNNKPQIISQIDTVYESGSSIQHQVEAFDPDDDVLRYFLMSSPTGAEIDAFTGEVNISNLQTSLVQPDVKQLNYCEASDLSQEPLDLSYGGWEKYMLPQHMDQYSRAVWRAYPEYLYFPNNTNGALYINHDYLSGVTITGTYLTESRDNDGVGVIWGFQDMTSYNQLSTTGIGHGVGSGTKLRTFNPGANLIHVDRRGVYLEDDTLYSYEITYNATGSLVKFYRDGLLIFTKKIIDDSLPVGRFGFFNNSQGETYYTAKIYPKGVAPDLTVAAIDIDADGVISASIINRGLKAAASGIKVDFYEGNPLVNGRLLGSSNLEALSVGETSVVSLAIDPIELTDDVYVFVDPDFSLPECYEENNVIGSELISFKVTDEHGLSDYQARLLQVDSPNDAPVIVSVPEEGIEYNKSLRFSIVVADKDVGDQHAFELIDGPEGMTVTNQGQLLWVPAETDIGDHDVAVRVTDLSGASDYRAFVLSVTEVANHKPYFINTPKDRVVANQDYYFNLNAEDPESETLVFSIDHGPAGLSIDSQTGELNWSPSINDLGYHFVMLKVADSSGNATFKGYSLRVVERENQAPILFNLQGRGERAIVGEEYRTRLRAYDPDGDELTVKVIGAPEGMTVVEGELAARWTPTRDQVGKKYFVTLLISDGIDDVVDNYVVVASTSDNHIPVVISDAQRYAVINELYEYQLKVRDADGDAVAFQLLEAPPAMQIDEEGKISWQPSLLEVGEHSITIRLNDGYGSFDYSYMLTVSDNHAPQILSLPAVRGINTEAYRYDVIAEDIDQDFLVYQLINAPEGMFIDLEGKITWANPEFGTHTVSIKVKDPDQAYSIQTYELLIEGNVAPTFISRPVDIAFSGFNYTYQLDAKDDNGDEIAFELIDAPEGMSLDDNNQLNWQVPLGSEGSYRITVSVTDQFNASTLQNWQLLVKQNESPEIISAPSLEVFAGQFYQYQVNVFEPDFDAVEYHLVQAPANMNINTLGLVTWLPSSGQAGIHSVTVRVVDIYGNEDLQTYSLRVRSIASNSGPVFANVEPPVNAVAGYLYEYTFTANDIDGDELRYSLVEAPQGVFIDEVTGEFSWQPVTEQVGTHKIGVRVSDGLAYQDYYYYLTVDAEVQPIAAYLSFTGKHVLAGEKTQLSIQTVGGLGQLAVQVYFEGQLRDVIDGSVSLSADVAGRHDVVVIVSDSFGSSLTVNDFFTVREPLDVTAPEVIVHSPGNDSIITLPQDLMVTIKDDNLVNVEARLYSYRSGQSELLYQGSQEFVNQAITQIDPSQQLNGMYQVQVFAEDTNGQLSSVAVPVVFDGNMKVGNFSFTVEDVNIPMIGLPITVSRTYDTRRKSELLDFGYGWSIDYQNVVIEENFEPTSNWSQSQQKALFQIDEQTQAVFTATCTQSNNNNTVTITLPNGQVERFKVRAKAISGGIQSVSSADCYLTASRYFDVYFEPQGDTTSTLAANDTTNLYLTTINGGNLSADVVNDSAQVVNEYTLTTRGGYVYQLDQNFGVKTIQDPNGNTLTYTSDGIYHSAGLSILFERDYRGFIRAITLPDGEKITYLQTSRGDLATVSNQLSQQVNYTYDESHALIDILDPSGNKLIKNIYDYNGRLIAQLDADGNRIDFDHDLEGKQSSVTNRLGYTTVYYYDNRGNVINQVNALGEVTQYTYDANDNQLSSTNGLGYTQYATFNADNDQLTQTDEEGNTVSFTYNDLGQELTVVDARGNTYEQVYDEVGNLISIDDPLGNSASNVIDASGLVTQTIDALGNMTRYFYDDKGRKLREIDALGNTMRYTYDANGNVLTETVTRSINGVTISETTAYEYDELQQLVKTTDALGNTMQYVYDALGNEVTSIDSLGRETHTVYDAYGRVISINYPDGTTVSKAYDVEGNLLVETDRLGRETRYQYDALNRVVKVLYADGASMQTEYDAAGRVVAEIDANGNRVSYSYDKAGKRTAVIDAFGQVHQFIYDEDGNLIKERDANGHQTSFVYNALDQRVQTQFDNGTFIQEGFDALQRRVAHTDQAGIATEYEYDALGRLTKVIDVQGNETSYTYDSVGNKLTQTDALGRTTTWTYDALGRIITRTLPLGQVESFTYDEVGNVLSHTDFNGDTTHYSYDPLNDNLEHIAYADGSGESFTYYANGTVATALQISAIGEVRETRYEYDLRDRLVKEVQPTGIELHYMYDSNGNRTSVTVVEGLNTTSTTYTYDQLNRLATVTDHAGQVTSYGYDAVGNRASIMYPNGNVTEYVYDSLNRLTRLVHKDADGVILSGYTYELHETGRREKIAEDSGRVTDYSYDNLYRLTAEVITDAENGDYEASYVYDVVGNRTYETVDGVQTAYSYDNNDRLLSHGGYTYSYDNQGNTLTQTIGGLTTQYVYNSQQEMTGVINPDLSLITYEYNINGIRSSKTELGATVSYVVDENTDYAQVLVELEAGSADTVYTFGDDLISLGREDDFRFYLYDGLGSTRALSDVEGNVTDTYHYEAFGELLASSGDTENNFRFTGEQYDESLGQYYLRARYYNPKTVRFTQMDSWLGADRDPQSLNKFLYVHSDPVNRIDPTGHMASPYKPSFGQKVDDHVCQEYKVWAASPTTICDSPIHFGFLGDYLKPDIFDPLRHRYAEVKPLSINGIGSGIGQMEAYDMAYGPAGFSREIGFTPAPAYVEGSQLYFFNSDGIIFYTDDEAEKEALQGIPVALMRKRYRKYWRSQVMFSAMSSSIGVVEKVAFAGTATVATVYSIRMALAIYTSTLMTARYGL